MLHRVNEATHVKHLFLVGIPEILRMFVSGCKKSKKLFISENNYISCSLWFFLAKVPVPPAPQSCFTFSKNVADFSAPRVSLWGFPGSFY